MVSEIYKIPTVMLRYAHTQGSCTVSHCYNFIFKVLMLQGWYIFVSYQEVSITVVPLGFSLWFWPSEKWTLRQTQVYNTFSFLFNSHSKQSSQFSRTALLVEVECLILNWSMVGTVCLWRCSEWSSLNQPRCVSVVEQKVIKTPMTSFQYLTENSFKRFLLFQGFSARSCITL